MKLNFRKVCLFWGVMDLFYITRFIFLNVEQGRIPLVNDIISFSQVNHGYGGGLWIALMFFISLMLNVSIVISATLLVFGWCKVRYFIFAQILFRLLLVVPSISFIPWLLKKVHVSSISILIVFLVLSEVVKVASFIFSQNTKNEGVSDGE